jgi:hypothetical protein
MDLLTFNDYPNEIKALNDDITEARKELVKLGM